MFTRRSSQLYASLSSQGPASLAEQVKALSGVGPTAAFGGAVSVQPPTEEKLPDNAPGRNARGPRWLHRPANSPARDNHAGGLYNVDVPRGALAVRPADNGQLLDTLREPQLLSVEGPATLGDTCVRNLRGGGAILDSLRTDSLIVGPGGITVEGNVSIVGGLTASGPALHSGGVVVEGDFSAPGDTSTQVPNQAADAELVTIEVVTDVTWDGTSLIKTFQTVYVARVAAGDTATVVGSTTCP
jgi:hypothetical protein